MELFISCFKSSLSLIMINYMFIYLLCIWLLYVVGHIVCSFVIVEVYSNSLVYSSIPFRLKQRGNSYNLYPALCCIHTEYEYKVDS